MSIAHFEPVMDGILLSQTQYTVIQHIGNELDSRTVVTAGSNHFSPGRVRVRMRARTRIHNTILTVPSVPTVPFYREKPVTVAGTVALFPHLLSQTRLSWRSVK